MLHRQDIGSACGSMGRGGASMTGYARGRRSRERRREYVVVERRILEVSGVSRSMEIFAVCGPGHV